jgi:hypothetical protein
MKLLPALNEHCATRQIALAAFALVVRVLLAIGLAVARDKLLAGFHLMQAALAIDGLGGGGRRRRRT